MDKKYFEAVNSYGSAAERLHSKLDGLGVESSQLEAMFEEINSLYDKFLKVGKDLDESMFIGEDAVLKKPYENLPSHIRLEIIYKYDNGYYLCGTTDMETYLIPEEFIIYPV